MKPETEIGAKQSNGQLKSDISIDFYKEICNNIRVSDEISFKLLNIVPVLSGIGSTALVFLEKNSLLKEFSSYVVISLSICGALITFGLFKWELRNIQKCNWLIKRAEDFELKVLTNTETRLKTIQFADYKNDSTKTSPVFKMPWGKTQAEKLIYSVAIAVWLIPIIIGFYKILNPE